MAQDPIVAREIAEEAVKDVLEKIRDDPRDYLIKHNYKGVREDDFFCPLARYLRYETGYDISVVPPAAKIVQEFDTLSIPLPEELTKFVIEFDDGHFPELVDDHV